MRVGRTRTKLIKTRIVAAAKAAHKLPVKYRERRWLQKLLQNLTHVLRFEKIDRQVMHAYLDLNVWMGEVALL